MQLTDIYKQQEAGDLGRKAFQSGYRRQDNPFPLNSPEARQWNFSWLTAQKEFNFQVQYEAARLEFEFRHTFSKTTKVWECTIHDVKREMFYWISPNHCTIYFVRSSDPLGNSRLDITAYYSN